MSRGGFQPIDGGWSRKKADSCFYSQELKQSVSPFTFMTDITKYENCNKCTQNGQYWVPYHPQIVDVESELKNITRPLSDCDQFKYNPNCKRSGLCVSTFDSHNPIVLAPEVCPIIFNNIKRQTSSHVRMPPQNPCKY